MNPWDILIICVLAAVLFLAVYAAIRRKKNGKVCCGDCSACRKNVKTDHSGCGPTEMKND